MFAPPLPAGEGMFARPLPEGERMFARPLPLGEGWGEGNHAKDNIRYASPLHNQPNGSNHHPKHGRYPFEQTHL